MHSKQLLIARSLPNELSLAQMRQSRVGSAQRNPGLTAYGIFYTDRLAFPPQWAYKYVLTFINN